MKEQKELMSAARKNIIETNVSACHQILFAINNRILNLTVLNRLHENSSKQSETFCSNEICKVKRWHCTIRQVSMITIVTIT